jgi:hypothetical protein
MGAAFFEHCFGFLIFFLIFCVTLTAFLLRVHLRLKRSKMPTTSSDVSFIALSQAINVSLLAVRIPFYCIPTGYHRGLTCDKKHLMSLFLEAVNLDSLAM